MTTSSVERLSCRSTSFLALFPAILFLLALASFYPLSNIPGDVGRSIGLFVSPQVLELIQEQNVSTRSDRRRGSCYCGHKRSQNYQRPD
jgi:uncharacterized BrkB/YihY/UPF0761 family membrane protein